LYKTVPIWVFFQNFWHTVWLQFWEWKKLQNISLLLTSLTGDDVSVSSQKCILQKISIELRENFTVNDHFVKEFPNPFLAIPLKTDKYALANCCVGSGHRHCARTVQNINVVYDFVTVEMKRHR